MPARPPPPDSQTSPTPTTAARRHDDHAFAPLTPARARARGSPIRHTPLDRSASRQLLSSVRRGHGLLHNHGALTPYAHAALRERAQQRAAALTPARHRRRSGREQRDTPRNALRSLSLLLAPTLRPVRSSSSPRSVNTRRFAAAAANDDDDDDLLLPSRPRLSLPLDADDDDDGDDLRPPTATELVDAAAAAVRLTDSSFVTEAPRRAAGDQMFGRLSMTSVAGARLSEYYGVAREDTAVVPPFNLDLNPADGNRDDLSDDLSFGPIDVDVTRYDARTSARESDFGLQVPQDLDGNDETTFLVQLKDPSPPGTVELDPTSTSGAGPQGGLVADDPAFGSWNDPTDHVRDTLNYTEGARTSHVASAAAVAAAGSRRRRPSARVSKHGLTYPPLPSAFIKRVAHVCLRNAGLRSLKITPDTLAALAQASDWFFDQASNDLAAYAEHAGRKTINEADVALLMNRQRLTDCSNTLFSVAQKHLPRELLQDIRMPMPSISTRSRQRLPISR